MAQHEKTQNCRNVIGSYGFRKPILALTAQAMREDQEKCIEAGCTAHLAKPFTQKTLTDRLLTALNEDEVSS